MRHASQVSVCVGLLAVFACTDYVEPRNSVGSNGTTGGSTGTGGTAATGGAEAGVAPTKFMLGADISGVDEEMRTGITYEDTDGTPKSIFDILKNHGFNFVRLRAFVKPTAMYGYDFGIGGGCMKADSYCDTAHTVAFAQLAKAAGMGIVLDLHYSDNWADPGHQVIPEDWRNVSTIDELAGYLSGYTQDIINTMLGAGVRPDIVQVGNEITGGMVRDIPTASTDCWGNNVTTAPVGGSWANWTNLGILLKAGADAVKSIDSSIKVMMHIENTRSAADVVGWVNNALAEGVPFDIVGLSCYEVYQGPPDTWQAAFSALTDAFPTLSFAIAEYNGQPTPANTIIHDLPGGRGVGTFFWEPTQSGSWGAALFTNAGGVKRADPNAFAEFDALAAGFGLK